MKFDQILVNRIRTITKAEVAKLPRVHIPNESILSQLMAWRDANKDAVRNFIPLVQEGTISVLHPENFQYFNVSGRDVFHMNVTSPDKYIAFSLNMDEMSVTEIANTIEFYPKADAIQDMITVHATVMAYLEHIGVRDIGDYFEIKEVASV